jgi:hypothetical protein
MKHYLFFQEPHLTYGSDIGPIEVVDGRPRVGTHPARTAEFPLAAIEALQAAGECWGVLGSAGVNDLRALTFTTRAGMVF